MNCYFDDSGLIMFQCDVCGRRLNSVNYCNGMSFCAKCYQETFGNNIKEITHVYGGNLKEHIKIIEEKDQRIAELEEQLKNAIILPKDLQVGNKIFWANDDGLYCGKIYSITKEKNPRGDFNVWFCCVYDNGLTYWHLLKDFNVEVFATKEEALAKLEELGE